MASKPNWLKLFNILKEVFKLVKKFSLLLLMFVMIILISVVGQAEEREISLEEASKILFDFLSGQSEGELEPVGINPLIEIVGFTNPVNANVYYVKSGDTLYKIAQRYNTTVVRIRELNNLRSDYLYIGQKLYLSSSSETELVYYVKAGDALYKIAQKYNTTAARIKEINNLRSDFLYIGQKLIIPLKDVETDYTHYVKSGDTLFMIANQYNTTIQSIKTSNNLFSDYLYVGQKLSIPMNVNKGYSGKRINVNQNEMDLLARAVYSEARGEPYEGQVAIAAVVINRVLNPLFPNSIEGVIFQPWQFTAVHDGQFWLQPNQSAYRASEDALNGWDPTGGAIYYYNPQTATSSWVFYRQVIVKIGQHYFAI